MSKLIEKTGCDIIKDLLPLYCDDVASEATREAVELHLGKCEDCRKEYERLTASLPEGVRESSTKRIFESMMRRKKISRIVKSAVSVVIICALVIGGLFVQRNIPVVMESPENIKWCHIYRIDTEYGKRFYIYHNYMCYYSSSMSTSLNISDDGKTMNLILKKALIAPAYDDKAFIFGLVVNESDNYSDGYSYFSKKDVDYSAITTVKLNGKIVWTETENGDDKIPEFVYKNFSSLSVTEDGVEMDVEGSGQMSWDWNGNIISKSKSVPEYFREETVTQPTAVSEIE